MKGQQRFAAYTTSAEQINDFENTGFLPFFLRPPFGQNNSLSGYKSCKLSTVRSLWSWMRQMPRMQPEQNLRKYNKWINKTRAFQLSTLGECFWKLSWWPEIIRRRILNVFRYERKICETPPPDTNHFAKCQKSIGRFFRWNRFCIFIFSFNVLILLILDPTETIIPKSTFVTWTLLVSCNSVAKSLFFIVWRRFQFVDQPKVKLNRFE